MDTDKYHAHLMWKYTSAFCLPIVLVIFFRLQRYLNFYEAHTLYNSFSRHLPCTRYIPHTWRLLVYGAYPAHDAKTVQCAVPSLYMMQKMYTAHILFTMITLYISRTHHLHGTWRLPLTNHLPCIRRLPCTWYLPHTWHLPCTHCCRCETGSGEVLLHI